MFRVGVSSEEHVYVGWPVSWCVFDGDPLYVESMTKRCSVHPRGTSGAPNQH